MARPCHLLRAACWIITHEAGHACRSEILPILQALIQLRETLTPESFNFMCECELGKEKAKELQDKLNSDEEPPEEDECKDVR